MEEKESQSFLEQVWRTTPWSIALTIIALIVASATFLFDYYYPSMFPNHATRTLILGKHATWVIGGCGLLLLIMFGWSIYRTGSDLLAKLNHAQEELDKVKQSSSASVALDTGVQEEKRLREELELRCKELEAELKSARDEVQRLEEAQKELEAEYNVVVNVSSATSGELSAAKEQLESTKPALSVYESFTGTNEIEKALQKFPNLHRVAVLGIGSCGKTTFLEKLLGLDPKQEKPDATADPTATVCQTFVHPARQFLLLDAPGAYRKGVDGDPEIGFQRFICNKAEKIFILLDHFRGATNPKQRKSESEQKADVKERLEVHRRFLKQLLEELTASEKDKKQIYFLLNKSDAWKTLSFNNELEKWFRDLVAPWKKAGISARAIDTRPHSSHLGAEHCQVAELMAPEVGPSQNS